MGAYTHVAPIEVLIELVDQATTTGGDTDRSSQDTAVVLTCGGEMGRGNRVNPWRKDGKRLQKVDLFEKRWEETELVGIRKWSL